MRTFAIGDIHGSYKGLLQCLERSGFNKETDTLIPLGDICDGWSETYECVEELLTIPNRIDIRGNHDQWFYEFMRTSIHGSQWQQGANATRESYMKNCDLIIPDSHQAFFGKQLNYHIDEQNRCFVHGGFNRHLPIDKQLFPYIYYWDRDLWYAALSCKDIDESRFKIHNKFKEIFIGHTTTGIWGTDKPMYACNIWNLDTGGGFEGKITIMDIDTHEYWQSDLCKELYSNEKGRN